MRVLIEFEGHPLLFDRPQQLILCERPEDLDACFDQVERALDDGLHVAGFLSYEAGYAFEPRLFDAAQQGFPLICMGCYRTPLRTRIDPCEAASFTLGEPRTNITKDEYFECIERIRDHIACGDVYQITYCLKLLFSFSGSAYGLYHELLAGQPVPYPAYIETDRFQILSLSPEMFLKKTGTRIVTKPMKGSWPRGGGLLNDLTAHWRLHYDRKNRAENVMIADLLRNDLGRIGEMVRAPNLFEVARYKTICQMTSTVTAEVEERLRVEDLFRAIYPSGSVTGAPKIRAMNIIRSLEPDDRKIYTGAIGYITPQREMFFNVPIRTLLLDGDQGELGIGGGIVWDSTPQGEWDEGIWKARFFTSLCS